MSDIGCLLTSCLINSMFTPALSEVDLPAEIREVGFLVAALPHLTFTGISSWITAVITVERCLCVLVPLKIKHMVTPGRMLITIASVYTILLPCGVSIYCVHTLGMKFVPSKNRTQLGLITITDSANFSMVYFALNSFAVPFLAFILICICTAILVYTLHRQTQWRNASTTSTAVGVSTRSNKVAKMVVMISSLYISCTIPLTLTTLALAFEPGLKVGGRHLHIGLVCAGIGYLAESINSSANIYIYYHMSSKFKETYSNMLGKITVRIKV